MLKQWITELKKLLSNKNMLMAFLLLLVLGFTFGYYATEIIDKRKDMSDLDTKVMEEREELLTNEENIATSTKADEAKVNKNTKIVFETEYLKSEDIDKVMIEPEEEIIGFCKEDLEDYYSGWTLIHFNGDEITLYKAIDSYSPKHFKVGITKHDGHEYIAVFNFNEEGEEVIDYISNKPIEILSEKDQNKLKQGMIFDNMDDVYRMLENYDL